MLLIQQFSTILRLYMHILYGTLGCHLCDQAQALLSQADITFTPIDIIDDDGLLAAYGQHIPVFKTAKGVLYWPFDVGQVMRLIDS